MNTIFILLCLASMIAIPVYLIKFLLKVVKKTDRSQPKKRLLIALAVFVISTAGGIATTPSTPSSPALDEPSAAPAVEPASSLSEPSAEPAVDPSGALPDPDADEPAAALPSEPANTPAAPASVQPAAAPTDLPAAPAESPQAAPVRQAAPAPEPAAAKVTAAYVGSVNTKKFHDASCSYVKQIKASNRVEFDSAEEAENAGYVPCKRCNP